MQRNLTKWLYYLESLPSGLTNRSLEAVKTVAKKLGVLNFNGKVVVVAGTNGKGSTVIFLESILLAAGKKTGAYISPHVLKYNERIRLNGKDIDDKDLCQAFVLVDKSGDNVVLSYFEFTTLAALVIFKKYKPDILILEVGLGGRFDTVNILDSDISVITSISFDHTHILGKTKDAIGFEKSGVMRLSKPVVCGKNMPSSIYTAADNLKARLYCLDVDFSYTKKEKKWNWHFGTIIKKNLPVPSLPITSAAIALMVVRLLSKDYKITLSTIAEGLKNAFLIGRFQHMKFADKYIIFDVAHNFESATLLASNLGKEKNAGRILAVFSILKDKDMSATLIPLVSIVDKWYLGVLNGDRAANRKQLLQSLKKVKIDTFVLSPTVVESFEQAVAEYKEKDKIVVFGSFHTVAEVLERIKNIGGI